MTENVRALVSGTPEEQLNAIASMTASRLCLLLGADIVPAELAYIVDEVTISRFNRIGSEGTSAHTVEGESMSWNNDDDFAPYLSDIQAYTDAQGAALKRVRFL